MYANIIYVDLVQLTRTQFSFSPCFGSAHFLFIYINFILKLKFVHGLSLKLAENLLIFDVFDKHFSCFICIWLNTMHIIPVEIWFLSIYFRMKDKFSHCLVRCSAQNYWRQLIFRYWYQVCNYICFIICFKTVRFKVSNDLQIINA